MRAAPTGRTGRREQSRGRVQRTQAGMVGVQQRSNMGRITALSLDTRAKMGIIAALAVVQKGHGGAGSGRISARRARIRWTCLEGLAE